VGDRFPIRLHDDGKVVKIASMTYENTRVSRLNIVERSITRQAVGDRAGEGVRRSGRAADSAADEQRSQSWFPKRCNGSATKVGIYYIRPSTPWNNGYIESFNNRLRKECLNRTYWNTLLEARSHRRLQASTAIDTGIQRWATKHRSSTLPDAHTPVACRDN
jgi:hypothetical protein